MVKAVRKAIIHARKPERGFTLLEMLLVVALIAILASIVILAINPGKQLAEARNVQRRSDVNTILNAVYQYSIDNNGSLPGGISLDQDRTICSAGAAECTNPAMVDLSLLTENETYLTDIPHDPNAACQGSDTCYGIYKSVNGRITVSAAQAELGATISITR